MGWIGRATPSGVEKASREGGVVLKLSAIDGLVDEDAQAASRKVDRLDSSPPMFNEGLDFPAVDRVIMLRPTESKVVFLQQLGRGLRASEGLAGKLG